MGVTRRTGDEAERWDEARRLLAGGEPGNEAVRQQRRGRLLLLAVVAVLVLATFAGFAVALLSDDPVSPPPPDDVPVLRGVLGLVLAAAGLIVMVVALVRQLRRLRRAPRSPLRVLSAAQRKGLARQVQGRTPVDAAHLDLARYVAHQAVAQRDVQVNLVGLAFLQVGVAVSNGRTHQIALAGLTTAMCAVLVPLTARQTRRARAFLDRHPEPALR